jgi:hypothetical protein
LVDGGERVFRFIHIQLFYVVRMAVMHPFSAVEVVRESRDRRTRIRYKVTEHPRPVIRPSRQYHLARVLEGQVVHSMKP